MTWIDEVRTVQAELGCSYKEALQEASSRRMYAQGGGVALDYINNRIRGIKMAYEGTRTNIKPQSRRILGAIGSMPIVSLWAVRRPIPRAMPFFMKVINGLSGYKPATAHDTLFHLFLVCELQNGSQWVVEKNENINVIRYQRGKFDEAHSIPINENLTIQEMLTRTANAVGSKMFHYDAFHANCQMFVMDVLTANKIPISQDARSFILQDVKDLVPEWAEKLASIITSAKNRIDTALEGYGVFASQKQKKRKAT